MNIKALQNIHGIHCTAHLCLPKIPEMFSNSFFKKFVTCLIAGLACAALLLVIENGGNIPWFPPIVVFSLAGIALLASLAFPVV